MIVKYRIGDIALVSSVNKQRFEADFCLQRGDIVKAFFLATP